MLRASRLLRYRTIKIDLDRANKVTTIRGVKPETVPVQALPKISEEDFDTCPLRSRGIEVTKNDVLLLKQFVRHDGTILKKEETKLAQTTYDKVFSCIRMAQREGLLPSDEAEYDHHGAPLPNIFYKDARYEAGSRQGRYLLTNKMPREQYWWLREGYDIGDPVVERDAPRVNEVWPKRTHVLSKYYHDDPRVKRD